MGMHDEVARELVVPADREETWSALTEREGLEAWLAEEAELELRPGGEARFALPGGEERTGFVEEVAPGERLVLWWSAEDDSEATRVELVLEDDPEGTRVRVVESRPLLALDVVGVDVLARPGGAGGPQALALVA
jgi:uncharacterized protein YndB with AHSA1/START domain